MGALQAVRKGRYYSRRASAGPKDKCSVTCCHTGAELQQVNTIIGIVRAAREVSAEFPRTKAKSESASFRPSDETRSIYSPLSLPPKQSQIGFSISLHIYYTSISRRKIEKMPTSLITVHALRMLLAATDGEDDNDPCQRCSFHSRRHASPEQSAEERQRLHCCEPAINNIPTQERSSPARSHEPPPGQVSP